MDEHKCFKGFTNVCENLYRRDFFKMLNDDKLVAKVPRTWKKCPSLGVVIPHEMRNRNKFVKHILCDGCDDLVNQNK